MNRGTERRSRRRGHPEPIGTALDKLVAGLGIDRTLQNFGVMASWESIVGERIARVTKPVKLENGVLLISVATAPWRAELSMQRMEIVANINRAAGKVVVREVRFR